MPLLKLFNTLLGRSAKPEAVGTTPSPVAVPTVQAVTTPPTASPAKASRSTTLGLSSPGLGLFGGGPHAGLCKLLKTVTATSVLEVSVDDGSRAIAILQTLAKTQPNVRYFAIDQFEMAGGPISLKQFHQKLRAENVRPQVFPETIERGLTRFSHTVGLVDLIVIAAPSEQWQTPAAKSLLARISHPGTVVLFRDGDSWRPFQADPGQQRRAA